jgi:putative ABC transport system permease protein
MAAFARRMALDRPETHRGLGTRLVSVTDQTVGPVKPTLLVIGFGVGLLFLAASANAATLLVARALSRQREVAVRVALGASGWDLLALAISESGMYTTAATGVGLVLGRWTLSAMLPLLSGALATGTPIALDSRAAVFTLSCGVLLGIGLAVLLWRYQPAEPSDALKGTSRTIGMSRSGGRDLLVSGQIACAFVLLIAAGLLMNSFVKLSRVNPGFDPDRVISFRLSLSDNGYTSEPRRIAFVNEVIERIQTVPGVSRAAITSMIPFGGARGATGVEIAGRPRKPGESIIVDQRQVTPDYFQTMRIPLVSGRPLRPDDDARAPRVVVINRVMADRYWPGTSALGARVRVTAGLNEGTWFEIVGVIDNVRHVALAREPVEEMYYAYSQAPIGAFAVVARTDVDPTKAVAGMRAAVRAVDRSLPIYDVRTMNDRMAASFAPTRATMVVLVVAAALAASFAAIAIYGSVWYSVSQRTSEIGLRIALGATRLSVWIRVVGRALQLTASGAAAGIAGALILRPLLAGMLFRTSAGDISAYAGGLAFVILVTILASAGPAWRAMRVDPVVALRDE